MSASSKPVSSARPGVAAVAPINEAVARFEQSFADAEQQLPGRQLPWLVEARRAAIARLGEIGLPKPRDEHWKYTRIAPIERRTFSLSSPEEKPPADIAPFAMTDALDAHQLVFVDGVYRAELSSLQELPAGVVIEDLRSAFEARGETLAPLFDDGAAHSHGFTALNAAFAADGVLIDLPRDVQLGAPVHLLFVASGTADTVSHPRIIINCAQNSQLSVIEHYVSLGKSAYFNNVVSQVSLDEGATLTHYKLQREASSAFHVSTLAVRQLRKSNFVSHSVNLGAALARHDINVDFAAPDSQCTLNGLYLVGGRQHVDYHTRVEHAQPSCTSHEDYRGILSGRSRGVFNAVAYVHPDAQKSDATQSNKNLLLSPDAEIDTKPQLEIHADDVKCAHGATVGQLDEEKVFYLRSRGLDEKTARGLLTFGFARDLIDQMPIEPVRAIVTRALLDQLPNGDELRSMLS